MSAKSQNSTDGFDPLAESIKRADSGKQIFEQFMERDAEQGLNPEEHTQAYQEMADYLKSRPFKDRNGRLHDPITGGFISDEEAGVFYTPTGAETKDGEEVDEYKSMSLSALAALSADAEFHNDRTTMLSVDDAIQEKIIVMDLKDELVERDGSTRENSERSMVLEHLMKLREQYLDKMRKDSEPTDDISLIDEASDSARRIIDEPGEQETSPPENDNTGQEDEPEDDKDQGSGPEGEPEDEPGPENTPEQNEDSEPNYEISDVALEALKISRSRYAELSALRRGETLGKSKEELDEAKRNYEAALKQVNEELMRALLDADMTPEQAKMAILDSSLEESKALMKEIADKRIEQSSNKRFASFYQWFGKQKGFMGKVKKTIATAAVTAPLGIAAGAVGLALIGPVAGAAAGAAIARGIAKSLGAGKINKESMASTLAGVEGREDLEEATRRINEWMSRNPSEMPPAALLTSISEATTRERLSENRRRTAKLASIGLLVGAVSGTAAQWMANGGWDTIKDFFGIGEDTVGTPNIPGTNNPSGRPSGAGGGSIDLSQEIPPAQDYISPDSIPTGNFNYPWGWAESTFGGNNATPMLEKLVQRAQEAGLDVKWEPNPGGVRYIEVNGVSQAQPVIEVLKKFIKPGELPNGGTGIPPAL